MDNRRNTDKDSDYGIYFYLNLNISIGISRNKGMGRNRIKYGTGNKLKTIDKSLKSFSKSNSPHKSEISYC